MIDEWKLDQPRRLRPRSPLPLLRPTNGSDTDTLLIVRRLDRAAASNSSGLLPQSTHCYGCRPVDMATR